MQDGERICRVLDCGRRPVIRGLCQPHYSAMMAGSDARRAAAIAAVALPPRKPPPQIMGAASDGPPADDADDAGDGRGADVTAGLRSGGFMFCPPTRALTPEQEAERQERLAEYERRHAAGLDIRTGEPLDARTLGQVAPPPADVLARLRGAHLRRTAGARARLIEIAAERLDRLSDDQRRVWTLWMTGLSIRQAAEWLGWQLQRTNSLWYAGRLAMGLPALRDLMAGGDGGGEATEQDRDTGEREEVA